VIEVRRASDPRALSDIGPFDEAPDAPTAPAPETS
jgi:hypothetical protein